MASDLRLQSYDINFNLNLQSLNQLGSRFSYVKVPTFPVPLNCSVTANYGDLTTGTLSDLFCNDNPFNLTVSLYQPGCGGNGPLAVQYYMKGMKLRSQDFSQQDIGATTSVVKLDFLGQLGGPNDQNVNFFISGSQGF